MVFLYSDEMRLKLTEQSKKPLKVVKGRVFLYIKRWIVVFCYFVLISSCNLFAASGTWQLDADGNWAVNGNWTGATFPDNAANVATLNTLTTPTITITLPNSAVNVIDLDSLVFNASNNYILANSNGRIQLNTSGTGLTQSGSGNITIAPTVRLINSQTWTGNGAGTVTVSGAFTNPGGTQTLTKDGSFNLILTNGGNAFDGIVINAGALESQAAGAFGGSGITLGGGTLKISTINQTYNQVFTASSASTMEVASGITFTLGNGANDLTGSGALTKTGTGTLVLGQSSNHSGGITISAGQVNIGNDSALGTGTLTLNGGTLFHTVNRTLANPLNITATSTLSASTGRDITFSSGTISGTSGTTLNVRSTDATAGRNVIFTGNGFTLDSNIDLDDYNQLQFNNATGTQTFNGVISGTGDASGALIKGAAGTTVLAGANTFTGSVGVNTGVLNIRNGSALGTTAGGTTVASGAALELQNNITVGTEALTINNAGIGSNGALRNISGDNIWQGTVALGSSSSIGSDAGSLNISGVISGASASILTKVGAGTVEFSSANTYAGLTRPSAGILLVTSNNALGTATGVFINDTVTLSGGTLAIQGGIDYSTLEALTINGLGAGGNGAFRNISGDNIWRGNVKIGSGAPSSSIGSDTGTLDIRGVISGASGLDLAKVGAGTVRFLNANTYLGATTVNGGTLSLDAAGALQSTSSITLNSGGTLLFSGTDPMDRVGDAVPITMAGGTLSANDKTETLGAMTLTANSIINLSGGGTAATLTFGTGTYTAGLLTINSWTGSAYTSGTDDKIVFTPGSLSQNFLNNIQFTGFGQGAAQLGSGEIVPVPEPGTILSGLLLVGLLARRFTKKS